MHTDTQIHRFRCTDIQTQMHRHIDAQTQIHRHTDAQLRCTDTQTHRHKRCTESDAHRHTDARTQIQSHCIALLCMRIQGYKCSLCNACSMIQGGLIHLLRSRHIWPTLWKWYKVLLIFISGVTLNYEYANWHSDTVTLLVCWGAPQQC